MHIVWVRQDICPNWLQMDVPLDSFADRAARWRLKFYRRIWEATPPWATYDSVSAIYRDAAERRSMGEDVQVDHIIPLHGKLVCGLHVANNLEVIDRLANARKSNVTYPGMKYEQFDLFDELQFDLIGDIV